MRVSSDPVDNDSVTCIGCSSSGEGTEALVL
jgi:hypothetical protein